MPWILMKSKNSCETVPLSSKNSCNNTWQCTWNSKRIKQKKNPMESCVDCIWQVHNYDPKKNSKRSNPFPSHHPCLFNKKIHQIFPRTLISLLLALTIGSSVVKSLQNSWCSDKSPMPALEVASEAYRRNSEVWWRRWKLWPNKFMMSWS